MELRGKTAGKMICSEQRFDYVLVHDDSKSGRSSGAGARDA